jgi:hypothetical protein
VLAHIEQDVDGVYTVGDVYGITVRHGGAADVPYDTAIAFYGERNGTIVSGAAAATFVANGMAGSRLSGSVVVSTFLAPENPSYVAPFTVTVDLGFTGVGSTHASTVHFTEGSAGSAYVSFAAQRWRLADVAGSAAVQVGEQVVDGQTQPVFAPATVGGAQLLGVTSGEFNLVAQPSR